jgi:hypothetical protein
MRRILLFTIFALFFFFRCEHDGSPKEKIFTAQKLPQLTLQNEAIPGIMTV